MSIIKLANILVVDDDQLILLIVKKILEDHDYDVKTAENVHEATQHLNEELFQLIITDIRMPEIDGFQLASMVRTQLHNRLTPIIFLSSLDEKEALIKGLEAGGDDYIPKPPDKDMLVAKVKQALNRQLRHQSETGTRNFWNIATKTKQIISIGFNKPEDVNDAKINWLYFEDFEALKSAQIDRVADLFVLGPDLDLSNMPNIDIWMDDFTELVSFNMEHTKKIANLDHVCDINASQDFLLFNLKQRLKKQEKLQQAYLNSLTKAAENSPVRSARTFQLEFGHWQLSIFHESYNGLPGGDFYEVFDIGPKQKIIAVGDVMGKKWNAWFFVPAYLAYIRSTLRFFGNHKLKKLTDLGKLMSLISSYLYKDFNLSGVFSTLCLIYIDADKHAIRMTNAGFSPPLKLNNGSIEHIDLLGMLLGITPDNKYQSKKLKFNEGQQLLLSTDGYNEATDSSKEVIEEKAFNQFFIDELGANPIASAEDLDQLFSQYFQVESFDDDRTLLCLKKLT